MSALKLALGDIGAFVFRPWLRFEIQHQPTCLMDRAGQILLINLYTTHTQLSHTVRAERHAGTFQISRHFRHQDDIVIQL